MSLLPRQEGQENARGQKDESKHSTGEGESHF